MGWDIAGDIVEKAVEVYGFEIGDAVFGLLLSGRASINEALFLSEKEETIITGILHNIKQEYSSSIDKFSQEIIIAHLEVLFTYAERFYERQFITRKVTNHKLLSRLEELLNEYINGDEIKIKGLPSVTLIAEHLNVSPRYLGSVLKTITGLNTQQHIHLKLIDRAKERLSNSGSARKRHRCYPGICFMNSSECKAIFY